MAPRLGLSLSDTQQGAPRFGTFWLQFVHGTFGAAVVLGSEGFLKDGSGSAVGSLKNGCDGSSFVPGPCWTDIWSVSDQFPQSFFFASSLLHMRHLRVNLFLACRGRQS